MRNASFMDGRRQPLMHSNTIQIGSPSPNSSFALQYPSQTSAKGQKYASRSYQTTPKGTHAQPAKMGIKSGMTVEDLKRLTQQRMQSQPLAPSTTSIRSSVTPNFSNTTARAPVAGGLPKGMTVQELKQLTSLRLATQMNPPAKQVSMGSADKTVLSNVAKAHYRQCLMPSGAGQQSMYQNLTTSPAFMDTYSFASGDPTLNDVRRLGEVKEFRPSHFYPEANYQNENEILNPLSSDESEDNEYAHKHHTSFRLPDEAFPPPPMSENASFIPSWSPPPSRPKTLDTIAPPPVPFYSHQHQHQHISYKEYEASDQNAIIAPPPGLVRRPSMTVPWQVAEAVLNTPQMTVNRKTLLSPNHPSNSKRMQQVSLTRGNSSGLKSPAAEAATQLGSFPGHLVRQRSIPSDSAIPPNPAMFSPTHSIKRASFGNAAEFFKYRRRSKSRLELARDISDGKGVTGHHLKNVSMPGIDEQMVTDHRFDTFVESDTGMQAHGVEDRLLASMNISSDFIPFYQAVVSTKTSTRASDISSEPSIPPPPPEEEDSTDGDEGVSGRDSKGLPMMSPNGVRLRKVAELARQGSLSSADKNRFKDKIIQSSLGIGLTSRQESKPTRPSPSSSSGKSFDFDGISADRTEALGADVPLEDRLRVAAQLVADCVRQGKMTEFHSAMKQLDALRTEATIDFFGQEFPSARCVAFAPNFWLHSTTNSASLSGNDAVRLQQLIDENTAVLTPSHAHDDYYVIDYAIKHDGFIVTNDLFRDHIAKCRVFQGQVLTTAWVRYHCIDYSFLGNEFLPNSLALERLRLHKCQQTALLECVPHTKTKILDETRVERDMEIEDKEEEFVMRRHIDLSEVCYYHLPRYLLSKIHGQNGDTMKHFQEFTNTFIVLPSQQRDNATYMAILSIFGNEMGRAHAVRVLDAFQAENNATICSVQDELENKQGESMEIEDW
uniref:Uncharacterized protein AlNc14C306G10447 n=1 Tax=Albugo laibachii Nc14 TaxID=890382 RepID=F0WVY6_9STRA|nr:conserved hypothetical protein [Albugo laibachii Nc14]|eukprot:CCA25588.1 conserved hypothetical protein [Albugo laibachii Nc14]